MSFVGRGRGVVRIPDDIISAVYLGCEMSQDARQEALRVVAGRKYAPAVYEARRSDTSFRLEFAKIRGDQ